MQLWQRLAKTAPFWAMAGGACTGYGARTEPEPLPPGQSLYIAGPDDFPWLQLPNALPGARVSLDSGHALTAPVDRVCPAGTQETHEFECLYEKRGGPPPPCACEHVCTPGCAADERCVPDEAGNTSCQCHPALQPSASGCSWSGLLPNDTLDGAQGWDLYTKGEEGATDARIDGGRLELSVKKHCGLAWAGTTARLPARDQFPDGAALVFEYSSRGANVEWHTLASALIDGFVPGLPLQPAEGATERRCVALRDRPWLASLEFRVQVAGACGVPVDYALSLDNIRLEADPSCR